ncbi:hypothetical protein [Chryseobacterium sp. PET-29]|uniref:hypothetical protein n=1 Tax=Chryseobacterium sp. PET-29 TaxID=2983267 RepID=UPI0021E58649|nr:hypothetical protein [Chryseobacterium sp. PET-29]
MKDQRKIDLQNEIMEVLYPSNKFPEEFRKSQMEFLTIRNELTKESDRGCVLLASSHLDFMLEKLLYSKLIGSKKQKKQIFDFNGPLGTFSSKIIMSYSLGLLPPLAQQDVQTIRKIRNEFAHSVEMISFDQESVKNACNNFNYNISEDATSRTQFMNVVSALSGVIERQIYLAKKFEESEDGNLEERKKSILLGLDNLKKFINDL